jgi:hypothetical protein
MNVVKRDRVRAEGERGQCELITRGSELKTSLKVCDVMRLGIK